MVPLLRLKVEKSQVEVWYLQNKKDVYKLVTAERKDKCFPVHKTKLLSPLNYLQNN